MQRGGQAAGLRERDPTPKVPGRGVRRRGESHTDGRRIPEKISRRTTMDYPKSFGMMDFAADKPYLWGAI